jgi:signal transduction histidine kinase
VTSTVSRIRAWIQSHPVAADAGLAAVLLGTALVSSNVEIDNLQAADPSYRPPSTAAVVAGVAAVVVPVALRRRAPLSALVACTAGFLLSRVALDSGDSTITSIVMSLAVYSAAAHGRQRRRNWVCAISLVAVMAELVREVIVDIPPDLPSLRLVQALALLLNVVLFCAMWALGGAIGSGRRRTRELLERTVELEHEREDNARRAVFDERVRIARELHDVVAHHVSMMGVQAGAARVVIDRDPANSKAALASIESSSRQAVLELHRLLGFLRQEGDPDALAPQPGLGQLSRLAATMSDAELTVAVRVEGQERPLPATVDVSAYRIVQEALTNTLKHAGASRADVHLRYWPGELEVEIIDDGRGNGRPPSASSGLGLIGMRERAGLHGGQLFAGPAAGGGFAVRVRLPTPKSAL